MTEELGALLGGVAVSQGQLRLLTAIGAVALGGWLATALLYVFGWWKGRWVRERFPRAGAHMKRLLRAVRRRPWRSALAVRFAFGVRLLLPLACGAAHLRADVYLLGTLVSSIAWSALFVWLGSWFGETAVGAIQVVRRYDQYAVGVVAGLVVLVWLTVRQRRRARAEVLERP